MKVIVLLNEKGGVGKTAVSIHLASGLATLGSRVLLVDADAQGNATLCLGYEDSPGFYNFIVRQRPFREVIRPVGPERYALPDSVDQVQGSLFLMPGNIETRSIVDHIKNPFILLERLQSAAALLDYVIIDTSPSPSMLHAVILAATDFILVPTKLEYLSIRGLRASLEHTDAYNDYRVSKRNLDPIQLIGIQPTMYRAKTFEHNDNLEQLRLHYPDMVWPPIREATIWAEATTLRRTVYSIAPTSRATSAAWKMVDQFLTWEKTHAV